MADVHTKKQRSYNMSRIRASKTKPELILRDLLIGTCLRYQPSMYGKPDFALKSKKIVIFVDGCFWHKCRVCFKRPKSNKKYWDIKFARNIERDKQVNAYYKKLKYNIIRVWEHQIKKNPHTVISKIKKKLKMFD